jgi:TRAP-type C4-dicarboxylate transport system permease small subunit
MQRFVASVVWSYIAALEILIGALLSVMIAVGFAAVVGRSGAGLAVGSLGLKSTGAV